MRLFVRLATVALTVAALVGGSVVAGTRLFSAPDPRPAGRDDSIGPWTGSLYVLDPASLGETSLVHALGQTDRPRQFGYVPMGTFPAGYDPQLTLSPDGSRLYVISSFTPAGIDSYRNVIDTYDTRTRQRLSRTTLPELDGTNKNRTLHKLPVFAPDFVSSLDGSRLYLGERTVRRGPVRSRTLIGTFDTRSNELLADSVEIPGCDIRVIVPGPRPEALSVVCSPTRFRPDTPSTNSVYFLDIDEAGGASDMDRLDLGPASSSTAFAWAASSSDARTIYAVTREGHVYVVDAARREVVEETDLDLEAVVQTQKVALSSDGGTLYVGTAPVESSSVVDANGIVAYDTRTWQEVASVEAEDFFWTMTLGPRGDRIYAPTYGNDRLDTDWSIQVFDARTLDQLETVEDVGRTPSLIEVPRLGR